LCLSVTDEGTIGPDGPVASRWAEIFDESFKIRRRIRLAGAPSRVRVSPDGRYAAATVFDSGHSYADHRFSTRTTIFNLETAEVAIDDLETVETRRDGVVFSASDFNFWGVTFARDGDIFYATLDTGGTSYLVKGHVNNRVMHVVHAGVECPSLSPDNTRVAFKRRVGSTSRGWWQIAVLELTSMKESLLTAETRSVDDQVEWLDDERVAYHLTGDGTAADLWAMRVDGTGRPEQIRRAAYSPAVLR
jgi:Tol biopolymer transport system component